LRRGVHSANPLGRANYYVLVRGSFKAGESRSHFHLLRGIGHCSNTLRIQKQKRLTS